jgi:hypothetical protein
MQLPIKRALLSDRGNAAQQNNKPNLIGSLCAGQMNGALADPVPVAEQKEF